MKGSRKHNTYSKTFKLDAIRMYLNGQFGGYTPVSKMLGICRTNLINWVAAYSREGESGLDDGRGQGETKLFVLPPPIEGLPIQDQNLRLRAENAYLRSLLELNIDNIKKKHTTK
jgi:transposase